MTIHARQQAPGQLRVTIMPSTPAKQEPLDVRLARRVIDRASGRVVDLDGARQIQLPAEAV